MQFTYVTIYLLFYLIIIWLLLSLAVVCIPLIYYSQLSLTNLFNFLKSYTSWFNLFCIIILISSGLPPVGFFFLKFNFIIFLLAHYHPVCYTLIFLMFFMNMIYYLHLLKFKRGWFLNRVLFLFLIKRVGDLTNNLRGNTNVFLPFLSVGTPSYLYNLIYVILVFLLFLFYTLFIFTDIFLIIHNFFYF